MGICSAVPKQEVIEESLTTQDTASKKNQRLKDKYRDEAAKMNSSSHFIKSPSKVISIAIDNNVIIPGSGNDPSEVYDKEKILGKGAYGTVHGVKHKQLHRYYAMKVIQKDRTLKEDEDKLMNEIKILKKLDHPNILKINDFYSLPNEYCIITEYCQEGEGFNEIKTKAPFDETVTGYYMRQILTAVCYCHGMNIIHRDLKPENILIIKRAKNGCHPIKIIDFGTAKMFSKGHNENVLIGSPYYISPDVLSRNYTEKCDLWSCGVIMYILLTGRPPFGGKDDTEILSRIRRGKYDLAKYPWGIISNEAKDGLNSLGEVNPNKRLSAEDALKHHWFKGKKIQNIEKLNHIEPKRAQKLVDNLKRYNTDNALRCAVIAYGVHNNTQLDQAHEAIKLFNKIDVNSDGKIVKEEGYNGLQCYLKLEGTQGKEEVDTIFANIDSDHNGYIEYEEFIRAAIDKEYFLQPNFLKFAFNYFDQDRSGEITFDEVTKIFFQNDKNKADKRTHEQGKRSYDQIDINGDNKGSFEEFCKMMQNIINS